MGAFYRNRLYNVTVTELNVSDDDNEMSGFYEFNDSFGVTGQE